MKRLSFEVEGLNKLLKTVEQMPQEIQDRVEFELEDFVREVNNEQVTRTPVDMGFLRGANDFRKDAELQWSLSNRMEYAPYIEFGTGGSVNVPAGLEDYAIQFKGKGIKQIDLPARPFFFEPFFRRRKELVQAIKKALTNI